MMRTMQRKKTNKAAASADTAAAQQNPAGRNAAAPVENQPGGHPGHREKNHDPGIAAVNRQTGQKRQQAEHVPQPRRRNASPRLPNRKATNQAVRKKTATFAMPVLPSSAIITARPERIPYGRPPLPAETKAGTSGRPARRRESSASGRDRRHKSGRSAASRGQAASPQAPFRPAE